MKTRSYVRFLNRSEHFTADLELVDVLSLAVARGALHSPGGPYIFVHVNVGAHPTLARRRNTTGARRNAIGHLKATLHASFIKDLYEDAMLYFAEVLEAAARRGLNPGRLVGDHQTTFKANDLLSAGSWPDVVKLVSNSVFRSLENERSARKLLEKLDLKLNLGVDQAN